MPKFSKDGRQFDRAKFQNLDKMKGTTLLSRMAEAGIDVAFTWGRIDAVRVINAWLPNNLQQTYVIPDTLIALSRLRRMRTMATRGRALGVEEQAVHDAALAAAVQAAAGPRADRLNRHERGAAQSIPPSEAHPASPPQASTSQHITPVQHPSPTIPQSNQPEASGSTSGSGAQAGPGPSTMENRKRGRTPEDDDADEGRRKSPRTSSRPTSPRARSQRPTSRSRSREDGPSTAPVRSIVPVDKDDVESQDGSSRPLSPSAASNAQRQQTLEEEATNLAEYREAARRRFARPLRIASIRSSPLFQSPDRESPAPRQSPSIGEPGRPAGSSARASRKRDRADDEEEPEGQPARQRSRREPRSRSHSRSPTIARSTSQGSEQSAPLSRDEDRAARRPGPSHGDESMEEIEEEDVEDRTEEEEEQAARQWDELRPRVVNPEVGGLRHLVISTQEETQTPGPSSTNPPQTTGAGRSNWSWKPTNLDSPPPPSAPRLEPRALPSSIAGPSRAPASAAEHLDRHAGAGSIAGPSRPSAAARQPFGDNTGSTGGPSGASLPVIQPASVNTVPPRSRTPVPAQSTPQDRRSPAMQPERNNDNANRAAAQAGSSSQPSHPPARRATRSPVPPTDPWQNPPKQDGDSNEEEEKGDDRSTRRSRS